MPPQGPVRGEKKKLFWLFSISKRTGEKWRCAPHYRNCMLFVVARSAAPSTKNFEGPLYFASGASGALGALILLQYSQDSSLQILGVPPSWAR